LDFEGENDLLLILIRKRIVSKPHQSYRKKEGFYCGFDTKLYQNPRKNRDATGSHSCDSP